MQYSSLITLLMASAAAIVSGFPTGNGTASLDKRDTYTGRATVYLQGGAAGSCEQYNSDDSQIVALSNYWMNNQADSPLCGRKIQITNTGSDDGVGGAGNVLVVTVADTCPSCSEEQVDLSVGAWNALTNNAAYGTFTGTWEFM